MKLLTTMDSFIFFFYVVLIQYQQKYGRRSFKTSDAFILYDYFGPALESEPLLWGTWNLCVGVEKLFFKYHMHLYYAAFLAMESKPILEGPQH